jgi:hypothetical protein
MEKADPFLARSAQITRPFDGLQLLHSREECSTPQRPIWCSNASANEIALTAGIVVISHLLLPSTCRMQLEFGEVNEQQLARVLLSDDVSIVCEVGRKDYGSPGNRMEKPTAGAASPVAAQSQTRGWA